MPICPTRSCGRPIRRSSWPIGRSRDTTGYRTTSSHPRPTRCSRSSCPTIKRPETSEAEITGRPVTFDIETKRQIVIDRALFPYPYAISRAVWRKDNAAYSFQYNQRGHMIYRVLEVDASTGAVRPMVDEVTKSFFMYSDQGHNFA